MYLSEKKNRQSKQINKAGFLIRYYIILSRGSSKGSAGFVDRRMPKSIPGLYSLDASRIPHLTTKVSLDIANFPWSAENFKPTRMNKINGIQHTHFTSGKTRAHRDIYNISPNIPDTQAQFCSMLSFNRMQYLW